MVSVMAMDTAMKMKIINHKIGEEHRFFPFFLLDILEFPDQETSDLSPEGNTQEAMCQSEDMDPVQ